jgi:hypothetical protein
MNDNNIENLLRKAPRLTPPPGLLKQLQADISLPRPQTSAPRYGSPAPWFKRWIPALSFASLLLGGLVILAMQADSISKLRQENQASAKDAPGVQALPEPDQSAQQRSLESQELERLRKEGAELRALRVEAAQLREQADALTRLRTENQKLLTELTARRPVNGVGDELEKAREQAESVRCVNNLKNIGLAARIFATEHQDVLPPDFLSMTNELSTPKILHCSSDVAKAEAANWSEFGPGNNSYEMFSPGLKESEIDLFKVILFRCPIHGHVGMGDGSVMHNPETNGAKIVVKDGKHLLVRPPQPTFQ